MSMVPLPPETHGKSWKEAYDQLFEERVKWNSVGASLGTATLVLAKTLLHMRHVAREAGDYDRADSIRDILGKAGLIIEDLPDGRVLFRLAMSTLGDTFVPSTEGLS